ncbi:MAG: hypothetical protein QOE70_7 [Chthoniobacter sp.]|jgi:hypothetical protein|nr:hypothetical protein [Chthoniobacter sp.]
MIQRSAFAFFALATTALAQTVDAPQPFGAAKTRTFPFSMTGKLIFAQGADWFQGSGTVIRPYSVLTAAHNLWDADHGFSTDLLFRRALNGQDSAGDRYASRVYVLGGYREKARRHGADDFRSFSQDLGALIFSDPVANGSSAGWWANPALLLGRKPALALGYGAQLHDGTELLAVEATTGFERVFGGFFDSESLFFEGGMSGGPIFGQNATGELFVTGVVVAGSEGMTAGGIRVLDATAAAFVRQYMK